MTKTNPSGSFVLTSLTSGRPRAWWLWGWEKTKYYKDLREQLVPNNLPYNQEHVWSKESSREEETCPGVGERSPATSGGPRWEGEEGEADVVPDLLLLIMRTIEL
jgi:hypothetical protein